MVCAGTYLHVHGAWPCNLAFVSVRLPPSLTPYIATSQCISIDPHLRLELRQHGHGLAQQVLHHQQWLLPQVCIPVWGAGEEGGGGWLVPLCQAQWLVTLPPTDKHGQRSH